MVKVFFFLLFLLSFSVFSQSTKEQSQNINSRKYKGYRVVIQDVESKVSNFWNDYLDDISKTRKKRNFIEISEFKIPDSYNPEASFYSRLSEKDSSTTIWVALDPETLLSGEDGEKLVNEALEEFMNGIPLAYRRYSMELKIMETGQAISFQIKQKEGLESDNVSLSKKLVNSKEDRIKLQKTLENLELSILATAQRIENNKISLELNALDLLKMKDLLEQYRKKLKHLK